jgi:hypothetical protein
VPTQWKGAGRLRLLLVALIVTSISVVGAVGTASATPPATTGVLEICKAASGRGVAGSFGFTIQGRSGVIEVPVDGCSFAITLPVGTATVTEVARPGFSVDKIEAPGRLRSSNLAARTATVDIVAGDESNQTLLIFTNKATPKGYLEICKASADDRLNGSFNFTVSQANRPTQTVTVPVGGCTLHPLQLAAGPATVTEAARSDAQLVSVTTIPSGRLSSVNLGQRTATVNIVAGEPATQTVVVFRNKKLPPPPPPTGQIKVCKRVEGGVTGTFTFTLANGVAKTVNVKAGSCSAPQTVPVGNLTVMEKATNGLQVSRIRVAPTTALVSGPNLQQGTVTVSIRARQVTEVEFTNRKAPPGTVKVCKVAGNGVVRGQPFSFTVGTTPLTVLAGSCSLPLSRPATSLTITEAATDRMRVTDITVAGAGSLVTKNLAERTATINVASGFVTEVIFTNAKPHTPVTGCLKPWKYFKHHGEEIEDLVPYSGLYVGSDALTAEQVHEILQGEHGRNPRLQLQSELITALLNQLDGVSTPTEVQDAINASQFYMSQGDGALHNGALNPMRHRRHSKVAYNGHTYEASHLSDTLRNFNGGKAHGGPRPCRKPWDDDYSDTDEYGKDKKYQYKKWRQINRLCWPI